MSKKSELEEKIRNIADIVSSYEGRPDGYCYISPGSGIYIKAVVEALQDIRTRTALHAETKADRLLMDIIANNVHPSW